MNSRLLKLLPWLVVAASTGAILLATLHQSGQSTSSGWSWSLTSGEGALAELLQNLILFIPFGIGLALCGVSVLRATITGALLSFSVEFAQQWIPGRDPSVGDIICNTTSAAIGAGLVRFAPRWLTVPPARSGWHALGAAILAVLVWFGTAAALRPTFPPPPYRVVQRPEFRHWGLYEGEVLETSLAQGILYVKATFPPQPPGHQSPLAAVLDAHDNRASILAVAGRDLTMRYHMPAVRLTLAQPDLRFEHAFARMAPADTFTATTGRDAGRLCLSVSGDWRCDLGYTIGDGWQLIFYPEHWPGWLLAFINACWVAGWTIGVGFWAGRTSVGEKDGGEGRRRAAKVAVALVLLGLIVVPMTTHLKGSSLLEWLGALLGIEAGLMLGSAQLTPGGSPGRGRTDAWLSSTNPRRQPGVMAPERSCTPALLAGRCTARLSHPPRTS